MTGKLKDIAVFTFFIFSVLVLVGYFFLLYEEVTTAVASEFAVDDFLWLGSVMVCFIVADLLIIKRLIRRARRNSSPA